MSTQAKDGPVGGGEWNVPVTDDERALWASVAECPEEDAPRLVYADWLDEHGRSNQAAFIRLQCSAEHVKPDDPHPLQLACDAERIRNYSGNQWTMLHPGIHPLRVRFRRGFPWEVGLTVPEYEAHGNRLPEMCHMLRCVRFTDVERAQVERLHHIRGLDRFDRVDFGYNTHTGPVLCQGVGGSPWIARVRELGLRCCRLSESSADWLAECPHLIGEPVPRLESLDVSRNLLDDSWVARVVGSPAVRTIRELDLSHNRLTDAAAAALATSPYLKRLEVLVLTANHITPRGVRALLDSAHLPALRTLQIADFGGGGHRAIQAFIDRTLADRGRVAARAV